MKNIEEYTPSELAVLSTVLGILIAAKLNTNEQNIIGNFLVGVGQTILTIAAQFQNLESQEENQNEDNKSNNSNSSNKDLQKQIDEIKAYLKKLEDSMDC